MGCFPVDFQEVKRPLRTKSVKRPIKVGKQPINERKRPIKAKVLVGVSVGCLMGCFRAPPPWRKTAPLKRPIKRSMIPGLELLASLTSNSKTLKSAFRENKNVYGTSPPLFSKKAMRWGKKWPVQMNLPFFAVKAYVPGGVQNQAEKKIEKCLPAGTGTKIYFSRHWYWYQKP